MYVPTPMTLLTVPVIKVHTTYVLIPLGLIIESLEYMCWKWVKKNLTVKYLAPMWTTQLFRRV